MAKNKDEKTNVMRILEDKGIPYTPHEYAHGDGPVDGVAVAAAIGKSEDQVFKTLVTKGLKGGNYVFVIPVAATLDLKKAARAAGEKSIEMIHVSEITPLTGYVRGGCSPVGMKKLFSTFFAEEIILVDTVIVSAGKIGHQIETAPDNLIRLVGGTVADLIVES